MRQGKVFHWAVDCKEADVIQETIPKGAICDGVVPDGFFDVCHLTPRPHPPGTFLNLPPLTVEQAEALSRALATVPLAYLRARVALDLKIFAEEAESTPIKPPEAPPTKEFANGLFSEAPHDNL